MAVGQENKEVGADTFIMGSTGNNGLNKQGDKRCLEESETLFEVVSIVLPSFLGALKLVKW